jgi:uncharacterized protein (TIGR01319 family)
MIIDILVAEIGSTTTKATAIDGIAGSPRCLGQGRAPTTVLAGDVTIGLAAAIEDLRQGLGADRIEARETFACASAAGGLKMSVHGLVYDMTARAAKEAALGAGANLKLVTAGLLGRDALARIENMELNIIMIAGGVDHGDQATAIKNAEAIAALALDVPVVYAGNVDARDAVRRAFAARGREAWLTITDNVYPKIDRLDVEAARRVIQTVFERHIVRAPGMEKIRSMVGGTILPTPGAVMNAAVLLEKTLGDLLVADVGGATTDIHSITAGSVEATAHALAPEPFAKRTVEGDLGVFVNRRNLIEMLGEDRLARELGRTRQELAHLLEDYRPIPDAGQIPLVEHLATLALKVALTRHAGRYVDAFSTAGMISVAEGKDLSAIRNVVGTGGVLARLPHGKTMLGDMIRSEDKKRLFPPSDATLWIDADYVFAAAGAMASKYPEAALALMLRSIGMKVE